MTGILTERLREILNFYWQLGQFIGLPVIHFRQIKYLRIHSALPYLDHAFSKARVDCARDLHKQLIEFEVEANSRSLDNNPSGV